MAGVAVGDVFPDIRADGTDTEQMRANGPIAVVVWRTGCPTCRLAIPFWERVYAEVPGAQVVGICQETGPVMRAYAQEQGITFPQIADEDDGLRLSRRLATRSVPTYYLVSPEGKVIEAGEGWDGDALQRFAEHFAQAKGATSGFQIDYSSGVPRFKPG